MKCVDKPACPFKMRGAINFSKWKDQGLQKPHWDSKGSDQTASQPFLAVGCKF